MTIGNVDAVGGHALENEQKLVTLLAASQIDIMIAPKSLFTKYAEGGYLMKLSDQLTTQMCTYLADSFYYSQPEGTLTNGAYGVYIGDSSIYQNSNHSIEDPPVLGIVVNSKHKDAAAEFIKFIYQDK
jgi:ABC-type glycerol-3-phosphate transport system substrate-binding protein